MASLKFRYGPYSNLFKADGRTPSDTVGIDNGTIYVTTDEKAMFVDLNNERIRVGGTVQFYDSVEEFTASSTPPYSTDALYFFHKMAERDEQGNIQKDEQNKTKYKIVNALMSYNGSSWDQINVSLDEFNNLSVTVTNIQNSVNSLSGTLGSLSTTVGEHGTKIAQLETALGGTNGGAAGLISRVAQNEADIDDLQSDVGTAKGAIEILNGAVTELGTSKADASALTKAQEDLTKLINENAKNIEANAGDIAGLSTRIGAAEGKISVAEGAIETLNGAVTGLGTSKADASALTKAQEDLTKLINENAAAIGANAGNISGLGTRLDTAEGKISVAEGAIETLNGAVTGLQSNKADASALTKAQEDLTKLINENTKNIGTNAGDISSLKSRMGTAEGKISTAEGDIDALESAVSSLQSNKADKSEITDARTDLTAYINNQIKAVNAMTFKGSIDKESDLPTTDVKLGDTYVLTTSIIPDGGTTVSHAAGDLCVATGGTEGDGGVIASGLTWTWVSTGYDEALNDALTTTDSVDSGMKDIKDAEGKVVGSEYQYGQASISLNNFAGKPLGKTTIKSASKNIEIKTTGDRAENKTIEFNLTWDTF